MDNVFRILAAILGGIAAYFLWKGNGDAAFIAAIAGAVSFFLRIRVQVKSRLSERDREIIELQDQKMREIEAAENDAFVDLDHEATTSEMPERRN